MNEVRLSVEDLDGFAAGTLDMARRLDQRAIPAGGVSTVAFESMEGLLAVLTPNRWRLLRRLRNMGEGSIRAVARELGRDYRGVHADVTALIVTGLIRRDAEGRISVPWSRIEAAVSLDSAA